ncbi:TPA: hypothetical protein PTV74_003943 [Clostridium botulinum]|uniref:DUF6731 family protein n=1 Tax=Clostridium botulinum TaxID=1491 RepID=UPI000D0CD779|nr:DUF6731 family protein [Clostridium botulinum]PSL96326.1 hypothetical protein C6C12_19195 [Clostridium botulinum]HDK7140063.1 hypothetical protein [Clostridium botulinum]HDK7143651.1 hypothetical protein [Clostridium botulinum]HDK7147297.1 hypothetical protein [Clostridium botulinum]HDK7151039.1 hypothetical protein [Clostridium botulinum]
MANYKRNIKFQYFKVVAKNKNVSTKFSFDNWAVYLKNNNLIMKTIELKGLKARIEAIKYDDANQIWRIRFMKLRDTNIPSTAKENKESTPLKLDPDEYIGEDVTMIYDQNYGIAMIQSNRFSLSYTRIEELINKKNPFEEYTIYIQPIMNTTEIQLDKNDNSKKFTLSFANIKRPIIETKSPLSSIINSYYNLEALSGQITLGVGRTKKEVPKKIKGRLKTVKEERFLNGKSVKDLIDDVYDNKDIVQSAKLEIRDDDGPSLEIIDLFDSVYHDYISFILEARTTLSFEYISNDMEKRYLKRKSNIQEVLSCG